MKKNMTVDEVNNSDGLMKGFFQSIGDSLKDNPKSEELYPFQILCGSLETMINIARKGVKGLNTKTMRYQIIDKSAKCVVTQSEKDSLLHLLYCDRDLKAIAKEKNLILK